MASANDCFDKVLKVILEENGLRIKKIPEVLALRLGTKLSDASHIKLRLLHIGPSC